MFEKIRVGWIGLKNLLRSFAHIDSRGYVEQVGLLRDVLTKQRELEPRLHRALEQIERAGHVPDTLASLVSRMAAIDTVFREQIERAQQQTARLEQQNQRLAEQGEQLRQHDVTMMSFAEWAEQETGRIQNSIQRVNQDLTGRLTDLEQFCSLSRQDVILLLYCMGGAFEPQLVHVQTAHPVAIDSDDHRFPRGARNDDTRHPRFVRACETLFPGPIRFLDLGCAGGGLVFDFSMRGHFAVGLEGSDYCIKQQRAEWRLMPDRLFTCDITRPFRVTDEHDGPLMFDVVSAWEVLEHIPEQAIPALLSNVRNHLAPKGIFAVSVATFEDSDEATQAKWHVTVREKPWWREQFEKHGFEVIEGVFEPADFPRGSGNGLRDWSAITNPELGFHLTARVMPPPAE